MDALFMALIAYVTVPDKAIAIAVERIWVVDQAIAIAAERIQAADASTEQRDRSNGR